MKRPTTLAKSNSKVMVDFERRKELRNRKVEQGISLYWWNESSGHETKGIKKAQLMRVGPLNELE
jgi:hypothetical protein